MKLNYYALIVAILANCIPETAFEKLQSNTPRSVKNQITTDDLDDMVTLHQEGLSYKEIGEIYCMEKSLLHKRLKNSGKLIKV
jgi:hypothetical protein